MKIIKENVIRNLLKSYLIIPPLQHPPLQHLPLSPQIYASSPEASFGAESLRWIDVTLSSAGRAEQVGARDYWIIGSLYY